MVVMKRFCFCFSIRMGTIIVGILSLIQATIWLMISLITIKNQEDVRDFLHEITDSLNVENKLFLSFAEDPSVLLAILVVFSAVYLVSCILAISGCMMSKCKFLYPFLLVDIIYIKFLLLLMVMLLINFKKRGYGVGLLILASNLGAFTLLVLIYMWVCVLSLVQTISELQGEIAEHSNSLK